MMHLAPTAVDAPEDPARADGEIEFGAVALERAALAADGALRLRGRIRAVRGAAS
jgi:hypothetical protein